MQAYQDALSKTSTEWAPWYIIPADKKWYRNHLIGTILAHQLKQLDLKYPDCDVSGVVVELSCCSFLAFFPVRRLPEHSPGDFLHDLGGHHGGSAADILPWVVLDHIRANQSSVHPLDDREHLPDRESARLAVGHTGCKGGVEHIEIHRQIDRTIYSRPGPAFPGSHLDQLDSIPLRLSSLRRVERANADLY